MRHINMPVILKLASINVDAVEDRIHRFLPDTEEQEVRDSIAREKASRMALSSPGATKGLWAGGGGVVGALLGAAFGRSVDAGAMGAAAGAGMGGLMGLAVGSGVVESAENKALDNISRQYLRKHPEHLPQYEAVEEKAREEARIKEEIARKEQQAAATRGTVLAGLAMATNAYANRTSTENKNINVNKTAADLLKEASPWAAALKMGTKAMANPLARRAAIGAGVGGTGNMMFGSPEQGSLAKRFATGAAVGAAAGGAYHAGVRLGMPTATKMGTKAWAAAKPGVTKGINKAKGLFRGKPKWGVGAGAPASVMPPMPNIMY
jgi:hypothetical protein